jgi:hypothetical protein
LDRRTDQRLQPAGQTWTASVPASRSSSERR